MTTFDRPTLFELLPSVHRVRDADQGGMLEGLLAVVQEQLDLVEADIDRLYDNAFIETCDEWVVPYIGDLLGVRGLAGAAGGSFSQRGLVANTIGYRRAKGTLAVLEQLALDVAGWPAKAVEFFQLLALTRAMNHERRSDVATVNVREAARAEVIGGPFGEAAHTADVRHVDNRRGGHNIPNVGLFVWRLQAFAVREVTAAAQDGEGRYTFDPLGRDVPLFNRRRGERELAQLAGEINVPGRLRRRPLLDELEARRQALADGAAPGAEIEERDEWFDDAAPVLEVAVRRAADGPMLAISPDRIAICDLSGATSSAGWRRPGPVRSYVPRDGGPAVELPVEVGVDPVLGRLSFSGDDAPVEVEVGYAYGFSGDVGAGPHDRRASLARAVPDRELITFQAGVTRGEPAQDDIFPALAEALQAWSDHVAGFEPPAADPDRQPFGVIAVMDSRTYVEGALVVEVARGTTLVIVAADWPLAQADDLHERMRRPGLLLPENVRPHLDGAIDVRGVDGPGSAPGHLVVDGLLVTGGLEVSAGELRSLRIAHCTLGSIGAVSSPGAVTLERVIAGPIALPESARSLHVVDSIVDGGVNAIDAGAVSVSVEAATILGATHARTLSASNAIFMGPVAVERRQTGCVRYCYLPVESVVPRPFRCQPADLAAADRVAPMFTSTRRTHPGFAQLASACPAEIARGAENEGEMGAFGFLSQPRRLDSLTAQIDEYLRFGLEAGVFFES